MELKSILSGLEGLKVKGNLDINVNEIRNSSNQVEWRHVCCNRWL